MPEVWFGTWVWYGHQHAKSRSWYIMNDYHLLASLPLKGHCWVSLQYKCPVKIGSNFSWQHNTDHVLSIFCNTRHCPRSFTCMSTSNPHRRPELWIILTLFYRQGNWASEKWELYPSVFGRQPSLGNITYWLLEWGVQKHCSKSFYKSPPPGPLFSFLKHVDVYNL